MSERIYQKTYYENNGKEHEFEAFSNDYENGAPYTIMLDGAFLATVEKSLDIVDEIKDVASWYGWKHYYSI